MQVELGNSGQGASRLSRETMIGPKLNDSVCSVKDHSEEFKTTDMAEYGGFVIGIWEVGKVNGSGPSQLAGHTVYFELNFAGKDGRDISAKIRCLVLLLTVKTYAKSFLATDKGRTVWSEPVSSIAMVVPWAAGP